MQLEGRLARELRITWIDARDLVTEARLQLGLDEVTPYNEERILEQAKANFEAKPKETQDRLHTVRKRKMPSIAWKKRYTPSKKKRKRT